MTTSGDRYTPPPNPSELRTAEVVSVGDGGAVGEDILLVTLLFGGDEADPDSWLVEDVAVAPNLAVAPGDQVVVSVDHRTMLVVGGGTGTTGGGSGGDEVWIGPGTPPLESHELWVDTDDDDASGGVEVGGPYGRQTTVMTTASLGAGESESGLVTLARGYRLYRIQTDVPARVRLYTTPAKRDADTGRPVGTDPTGDHGVVLEFVTAAGLLAADLSPVVDGFDGKSTPDGAVAYRVTSTAGTAAVTTTLTWIRTE